MSKLILLVEDYESLLIPVADDVSEVFVFKSFAFFFVKSDRYHTLSDFLSYFRKISPFSKFSLNFYAFLSPREYIVSPLSVG